MASRIHPGFLKVVVPTILELVRKIVICCNSLHHFTDKLKLCGSSHT
ncbi:hypothetical protein [Leptospira kirschneri]|uniref:Uncharacterized protein n=1 Tax=Leptospira kirschneri str. H1 TaxID=1049966 RepID=A0A0E2B7J5_9LEPT|nr:hypothetical protein [Leptospira kirschneri]EKO17166.1 hypothetical protein LEP1GSC081_3541 [Leptospira kirschneri str. H1]EKO63011.1 hypothetical protein LEP1GSC082_3246 [Leptospira kirschneri str. H2]UML79068.1 hypothetical protein FH602_12000 [Leptospira kirschneri]